MAEARKLPVTLLYGGIASLAMILFTIWTWREGVTVFLGPIAYGMYAIPVLSAVVAALVERGRKDVFGFRPALSVCFGVCVLCLAVQRLFTWILVHFIDPAFGRALGPAVLANTEAAYRRFGMPEDQVRENIEAAKGSDPFSLGNILWGLALTYLVFFFVSLLLAAILKKGAGGPYKRP